MGTRKYQILYVEDNAESQVLLKFYLKNEPYTLTFADNGLLASKKLKEESFDLFLVDMNLPNGVNGYDVAKVIRQDDYHKDKPVIIITAFSSTDMDEPDPSLHIDQFINKPIYKGEFIDIINSFLKK